MYKQYYRPFWIGIMISQQVENSFLSVLVDFTKKCPILFCRETGEKIYVYIREITKNIHEKKMSYSILS